MNGGSEVIGAVVRLKTEEAGVYQVTQVSKDSGRRPVDDEDRQSLDWSSGPTKVWGSVDSSSFDFDSVVGVNGISLGNVSGNLKDGVTVRIDLFTAKGELRFFLKNGNEVWVANNIKITFNGHYEGHYMITRL